MLAHMTHLMIDTDGSIKHLSEESHHFIALWKLNTEQRFQQQKMCNQDHIFLS